MSKGIYCLESMWNPSVKSKLTVRPILELLEKAEVCNHLYHKCAIRELGSILKLCNAPLHLFLGAATLITI